MIALVSHTLFAIARKAIIMHLNFATSKGPHGADEIMTFRID